MAKRKIPNTLPELRELHAKLKDKEAKLEAELAIRENSELEQCVMSLTLALVDIRKIEDSLKVMDRPKDEIARRAEAIQHKIVWHENQIKALKAMLEDVTGKGGKKLTAAYGKKAEAVNELKRQYERFKDTLGMVDVFSLLPSLQDYLK